MATQQRKTQTPPISAAPPPSGTTAHKTSPPPAPILRRRVRPWERRAMLWSRDWRTLDLTLMLAQAAMQDEGPHVSQMMLIGGGTDSDRPALEWWEAPTREGWEMSAVLGERRHGATYLHTATGKRIVVRMTESWFGTERDVARVLTAWHMLEKLLRGAFDPHAHPFGTPGRTGLDLLERSLPEAERSVGRYTVGCLPFDYPVLDEWAREQLYAGYGQGRMEFCATPETLSGRVAERGLWVYDARWQYAACLRHLPIAPFTIDNRDDFEFYRPGCYYASWEAPRGWSHIGLLPQRFADGTDWPRRGEGWVTHHELILAHHNHWRFRIHRRILGAPEGTPGSDPARTWADRLIRLREAVQKSDGAEERLVAGALRNILVQAIGHWWAADRINAYRTPYACEDSIPSDAFERVYLPSLAAPEVIEWRRLVPLHRDLRQWQRPEWAAHVWGDSRARTARVALTIPRRSLVAIRTDALITTEARPGLEAIDNHRPGSWRLKLYIPGPVTIPREEAEWRDLLGEQDEQSAEGGSDDGE